MTRSLLSIVVHAYHYVYLPYNDPNILTVLILVYAYSDIPSEEAGDYWIVRYNEEEGYAIISGGQPTIPSGRGDGLCQTGTGVTQVRDICF